MKKQKEANYSNGQKFIKRAITEGSRSHLFVFAILAGLLSVGQATWAKGSADAQTEKIGTATYVYDGTGAGARPCSKPAWPDSGGKELFDGALPANANFKNPQWVGFFAAIKAGGNHPQVTVNLNGHADLF